MKHFGWIAGSWATAFAQVLADAGAERVTLWARREEVAAAIRDGHRNPDYLSEVELPAATAVAISGYGSPKALVADGPKW